MKRVIEYALCDMNEIDPEDLINDGFQPWGSPASNEFGVLYQAWVKYNYGEKSVALECL